MEDYQRLSVLIPFVQRNYLLKGIYLWSGSIASIPATFRLCDGSLGTPDLRNRFIPGAGDTYVPGNVGGSINHNHPFTGNGHHHNTTVGTGLNTGGEIGVQSSIENATGTTNNTDKRPPYHSLAYIMYAGRVH